MEFTPDALGRVIRELREEVSPALSQDQLGTAAGYGRGAGVSISRIESGLTRPGQARLAGIALALQLTPTQLEDLARQRTLEIARDGREGRQAGQRPGPTRRRQPSRQRLAEVQRRVSERSELIQTEGSAYNQAHDAVWDAFLLPFVAAARRLENVPAPRSDSPAAGVTQGVDHGTRGAGALTAATYRLEDVIAGRLDPELPDLPAAQQDEHRHGSSLAAATSALALTEEREPERGHRARWLLVLSGLAVSPLAMLAAGGALWLRRRNQRQEEELQAGLTQAEDGLAATQLGFDAVAELLPRLTALQHYISVHAAHALHRWQRDLPAGPVNWDDLTDPQRQSYRNLHTVAGCLLAVDAIDISAFLTCPPAQAGPIVEAATATLEFSERAVHELV